MASLRDGPGEGGWAAFAAKVAEERDRLRDENLALWRTIEKLEGQGLSLLRRVRALEEGEHGQG